MRNKHTTALRCPDCGEIANFSHFYRMEYGAPVILEDGEITIDYDNETPQETDDDEDTCRCGKCGREVYFDDIEIVETVEVEA